MPSNLEMLMGTSLSGGFGWKRFLNLVVLAPETPWDVPADFTINSDADWAAIPSTYLTSGGIIHVNPAVVYADVVLSATPSAELVIRAPLPNGTMPVVNSFYTDGGRNLTLRCIDFAPSDWITAQKSACRLNGNWGNLRFDRCKVRGGYRGNRNYQIDFNKEDYPEYACIYVNEKTTPGQLEFAASGTFPSGAAVPRNGSYCGDLIADGSYSAVVTVAGGTDATVNYTVASGVITVTSQSPGSGYNFVAGSVMNGTRLVNHLGQQLKPMMELLAKGFTSDGTTAPYGFFEVTNCYTTQLLDFIKCSTPQGSGARVLISGNLVDGNYQDAISISAGPTIGPLVEISFNVFTRFFSKSIDPGNPHCDICQLRMNKTGDVTDANWVGGRIVANLAYKGSSRGSAQNAYISEPPPSSGLKWENWYIAYNGWWNRGNVAFDMTDVKNAFLHKNLVGLWNSTDWATTARMTVGSDSAEGWIFFSRNISEGLSTSFSSLATFEGNELLSPHVTADYVAQFNAPDTAPLTVPALIAAYTNKAGRLAGPFTGDVDFVNKTVNLTNEPSFWFWPAKVNQVVSTLITTDPSYYNGGPLTGRTAVMDAGQELRYADNELMTVNVSSWASSAVLIPGKYVQGRLTTPATGGTSVSIGMTVGGIRRATDITTASTPYAKLTNSGTGIAKTGALGITKTDIQKLQFAMSFRCNSVINSRRIFSGSSTTSRVELYQVSSGVLAIYLGSSSSVSGQCRVNFTMDTAWHEIIVQHDSTAVDAASGLRCWIDGVEASYNTRNFTQGQMATLGTILNRISIGGLGDGTLPADMEFKYLTVGWGNAASSMPDMALAINRNRLLKDNVGANWSNANQGLEGWVAYSADQGAAAFNNTAANSVPNLNTLLGAGGLNNIATGFAAA